MTLRYLELTPAAAQVQSARLWTRYEAQERAARGLRADQALDSRGGVPLPIAQAITNGIAGYVRIIVSDDNAIAAVPLDDWAQAQNGRGGVDTTGSKDRAALDARLRSKLDDAPG